MDAFVPVEREDDLAVAARLEVVSSGILFTDLAVVVDFPVDGQYLFTVGREKRLPAALRIDDGKGVWKFPVPIRGLRRGVRDFGLSFSHGNFPVRLSP